MKRPIAAMRRAAEARTGRRRAERLQRLGHEIQGTDTERAEIAAGRLEAIDDVRAVPLLVGGLRRHTALQVVDAIEAALISYGRPSVESLVELAADRSAGPIARASAASALGEIGDHAALPALADVLSSDLDDPWVRAFLTIAVAELGGYVSSAELRELAEHENPLIAERVAALLRSEGLQ